MAMDFAPNVIKKKDKKRKRSLSENIRIDQKKMFPTLGHIVLNNGIKVDIPRLPTDFSQLTSYDCSAIAVGHAAIVMQWARSLDTKMIPSAKKLYKLKIIEMNLEDILNLLHYSLENYPKERK